MISTILQGFRRPVYVTLGVATQTARGFQEPIYGVFASEEDARAGDGHEVAIIGAKDLTANQQVDAETNSHWLP